MWTIKRNNIIADSGQRIADRKNLYAKRYPLPAKNGFTLIELIVTITITAIVAAAVLSMFSGGINIYKRVKNFNAEGALTALSLEGIDRDLHNAFCISGINFTGQSKEISFAGLVNTYDAEGNLYLSTGKIRYYFDDRTKRLFREEMPYARAVSGDQGPGVSIKEVTSLRDIVFRYYFFDPETKLYGWKTSWSETGQLPAGVEIEAEFSVGAKTIRVNRIVFIPVAG